MSIKAKILTAIIAGSLVTMGGVATLHKTNNNTQAKVTNVSLLASSAAKVGQVGYLENQSVDIAPVDGKVLNNVPATITMNGKTIFDGQIYNGKLNLWNVYAQVGSLVDGLNSNGNHTVTLKVKGYEPMTMSLYVRKMYNLTEMGALDANMNIKALVNGKEQSFKTDNRGNLYLYSYKPFTFAPADANSKFARQYNEAAYQFTVNPYYVIESAPVYLKKEVKTSYVGQVGYLENQSVDIAPVDGKVLNNVPATVTINGKVVYDGQIYNGKLNLWDLYAPTGSLVDGLNSNGYHNVTLNVKGYKPMDMSLYVRKMYSMVVMDGLNPNTKIDAIVNGQARNFTADKTGSFFLYSYNLFTFKPANMNDNFGRQYQMESYQYTVNPYYVIESSPVYLSK